MKIEEIIRSSPIYHISSVVNSRLDTLDINTILIEVPSIKLNYTIRLEHGKLKIIEMKNEFGKTTIAKALLYALDPNTKSDIIHSDLSLSINNDRVIEGGNRILMLGEMLNFLKDPSALIHTLVITQYSLDNMLRRNNNQFKRIQLQITTKKPEFCGRILHKRIIRKKSDEPKKRIEDKRKKLENLYKEIKDLEKKIQEREKEIIDLQARDRESKEIEKLKIELSDLNNRRNELKNQLKQKIELLHKLEREIDEIDSEIELKQSELSELNEKQKTLYGVYSEVSPQYDLLKSREAIVKDASKNINILIKTIGIIESELLSLIGNSLNLDQVRDECHKRGLCLSTEDLPIYDFAIILQKYIDSVLDAIQRRTNEIKKNIHDYESVTRQIDKLSNEIKTLNNKYSTLSKQISDIKEEINKIENEIVRVENRISDLKRKITKQGSEQQLLDERTKEMIKKLQEEVKRLKNDYNKTNREIQKLEEEIKLFQSVENSVDIDNEDTDLSIEKLCRDIDEKNNEVNTLYVKIINDVINTASKYFSDIEKKSGWDRYTLSDSTTIIIATIHSLVANAVIKKAYNISLPTVVDVIYEFDQHNFSKFKKFVEEVAEKYGLKVLILKTKQSNGGGEGG